MCVCVVKVFSSRRYQQNGRRLHCSSNSLHFLRIVLCVVGLLVKTPQTCKHPPKESPYRYNQGRELKSLYHFHHASPCHQFMCPLSSIPLCVCARTNCDDYYYLLMIWTNNNRIHSKKPKESEKKNPFTFLDYLTNINILQLILFYNNL